MIFGLAGLGQDAAPVAARGLTLAQSSGPTGYRDLSRMFAPSAVAGRTPLRARTAGGLRLPELAPPPITGSGDGTILLAAQEKARLEAAAAQAAADEADKTKMLLGAGLLAAAVAAYFLLKD